MRRCLSFLNAVLGRAPRSAGWIAFLVLSLAAIPAYADPWTDAVTALQTAFTGPIARGLSLVSVVVGGLGFAFGEGDSKRMLAGILFGVGMALSAVAFTSWLFPG